MVWIPVILTLALGPGMGQFYNKEYKKGTYLVVISLVILLGAVVWLKNILMPYLPTDITTEDPMELTRMIQENAHKATSDHAWTFYAYQGLLLSLWGYSIFDAYKGGKRRLMESKLNKTGRIS